MRRTDTSYCIQQGDSNTLRVSDQARWYVVRETWERNKLLNSTIVFSSLDESEARARLTELEG